MNTDILTLMKLNFNSVLIDEYLVINTNIYIYVQCH